MADPKQTAHTPGLDLARWIWQRFVGIPITEPYDKEFRMLLLKIATYTDELKQRYSIDSHSIERGSTTPPPWRIGIEGIWKGNIYGPDGIIVAGIGANYPNGMANAAHIVRCVNSHDKLVLALEACRLQMLQSNNDSDYAREANDLAEAALRAAKEK